MEISNLFLFIFTAATLSLHLQVATMTTTQGR
jgi:hypothetical protein